MEAWDDFAVVLKENKIHELLEQIYQHPKLAIAKANEMKIIIHENAISWKNNKPNDQRDIIS